MLRCSNSQPEIDGMNDGLFYEELDIIQCLHIRTLRFVETSSTFQHLAMFGSDCTAGQLFFSIEDFSTAAALIMNPWTDFSNHKIDLLNLDVQRLHFRLQFRTDKPLAFRVLHILHS